MFIEREEINSFPAQYSNQESMVDLHGLSVEDSQAAIDRHIRFAEESNINLLRIVTGRGNHRNNQGERGTLYREFPNWLSEDHKSKIDVIESCDGYYEISMKPSAKQDFFYSQISRLGQQWLVTHMDDLQKAAQEGDSQAQYCIGHCFHYAIGVEKNYKKAVEWYEKSVASSNCYAQYALGGCYWQGKGVRQNDQRAIELIEAAARQDFPWAIHQLGDIYWYGDGVQADPARAITYYQKASSLGLDIAKRKLAHAYRRGEYIEKDEMAAFLLYKEVADRGDPHSAYNVACAYLKGLGVEKSDELAFKYAKQSADKNDPEAQYLLAIIYGQGLGTDKNEVLAFEYLKKSADNEHKEALFNLTFHPEVKKNREIWISYLIRAAKAKHIIAQAFVLTIIPKKLLSATEHNAILKAFWKQDDEAFFEISTDKAKSIVMNAYILNDKLTKKQRVKIFRLLNTMAEQNYPQAFLHLGMLYLEGTLVKQNFKQAEHFWLKGAELECCDCLCSLGYYYEQGRDGEINYEKAFHYYSRAAEKGSANAHNQLGSFYKLAIFVRKDLKKAVAHYHQAMALDSEQMRNKPFVELTYVPVYPHSAYNLATLYIKEYADNPTKMSKAIYWLKQAADKGHEQAKKLLDRLSSLPDKQKYTQSNTANFWKTNKAEVAEEKPDVRTLLKNFSNRLGLQDDWKITKDDKAWCYLEKDKLAIVEKLSLAPITIRKTKTKQYILLLEQASKQDLLALFASIELQLRSNVYSKK